MGHCNYCKKKPLYCGCDKGANPPKTKASQLLKDIELESLAYNDGKVRWELLPVQWCERLAELFTRGAQKYPAWNWSKSIHTEKNKEYIEKRYASMMRHIAKWRAGEQYDEETGVHHLICAMWNSGCIVSYELKDIFDYVDS